MSHDYERRRGWWRWAFSTAAIGVAAGLVGWAGSVVLRPAEDPSTAQMFTYVTVEPGEVGSSLTLNVVAAWEAALAGANQQAGVVTTVAVAPGDEVAAGSVLYSVNERPVVVAQGAIPAYRSIGEGSKGADVAQIQSMLQSLGHYAGRVDGDAGEATVRAIRSWQFSVGMPDTGVVNLGDVIFAPTLPARVSLDTTVVARGATVIGGEPVLNALDASPRFTLAVTESQAAMIPAGTPVEITAPGGAVWSAVAADQQRDEESQSVVIGLVGIDESIICGNDCAQVPVIGDAPLPAQIETVPSVSGLVVPTAALVTGASGQVAVISEDGERLPVSVTASARGMSLVEGVPRGSRVRIPASDG